MNKILIFFICLVLLFFISGGHPLITITKYSFDIQNNPIQDIIDNDLQRNEYDLITIEKNAGDNYITSNKILLKKEKMYGLSFDSLSKNNALYLEKDKLIVYPSVNRMLTCMDTPMLFCIPLLTEHRPGFRAEYYRLERDKKDP